MRRARQIRGLVGNVSGHGKVVSASKSLAERGGLDHPLVGKLFMRWCDNAQSRRDLVASRRDAGCLGSKRCYVGTVLAAIRAISLGRLLLESGLDDVSLLLADIHTTLQLLLHHGVLCDKAGRQASETDFLDTERVPAAGKPCRLGTRTHHGIILGEIQLSRPVSRGGQIWRAGLLLDEDLRGGAAGCIS